MKRARILAPAVAAAAALGLAACSGGASDTTGGTAASGQDLSAQVDAALEEGGSLLVWGWDATLDEAVAAFEDAYPNVDVELVNVGTTSDEYTAIQNAIAAGSGVPDVVHLEYSAIAQFAITGALADLTQYGAADLESDYTASTWNSVTMGTDAVYGLPMDSGPAALFYNATVLEEHGIEVPTTWEEYRQAAKDLHAADPDLYLVADTGDAGYAQTLIWQAGGRPFQVDGTDLTINLGDAGTTTYAEYWQSLIDDGSMAPYTTWSDEWYQALNSGELASLVIGAWMPAMLEAGAPDAAGDWRVAPMPQWEEGESVTAENGGSALAVTADSDNQLLAYGFTRFVNNGDGVSVRLDAGTFPATTADLASEEFLSKEFAFFGGQKVNEVLAEAAGEVGEGWQYLPFSSYANSIYNDYVASAFVSGGSLPQGLLDWGQALITYGESQGFTVNE